MSDDFTQAEILRAIFRRHLVWRRTAHAAVEKFAAAMAARGVDAFRARLTCLYLISGRAHWRGAPPAPQSVHAALTGAHRVFSRRDFDAEYDQGADEDWPHAVDAAYAAAVAADDNLQMRAAASAAPGPRLPFGLSELIPRESMSVRDLVLDSPDYERIAFEYKEGYTLPDAACAELLAALA